jgi:hypothetical protein
MTCRCSADQSGRAALPSPAPREQPNVSADPTGMHIAAVTTLPLAMAFVIGMAVFSGGVTPASPNAPRRHAGVRRRRR